MEKQKHYLTNEYLMKAYADNFSLALTAIEFAKSSIASGKDIQLSEVFDTLGKVVNHPS